MEQTAHIEQALSAKEVLAEAIAAAYLAQGYITADGEPDQPAVGNAIYPLVAKARVTSPTERATKAVTKGALFEAAFPALPKREDWPAEPDPQLAKDVDREIRQKVWNLAKPDKSGFVQKLVGAQTPGLILCRTKIGMDGVDAVYVTDDLACIKEDFAGPLGEAIKKANRTMSRNLAMVGGRLPEHAQTFERLYREANKRALDAGKVDIQLMLDAAGDDDDDGAE